MYIQDDSVGTSTRDFFRIFSKMSLGGILGIPTNQAENYFNFKAE